MVGNTAKDGSGNTYWILQSQTGALYAIEGDTQKQSDVTANDSDKTFTVPAGYEWIIKSIRVKLVTTSTVGNRQIAIEFRDGTDVTIYSVRAGTTQAASLTRFYNFSPNAADLTAFRDTDYLSNPIPEVRMPATYNVRVYDKAAIDAAADDMDVHIMLGVRPTA